METKEAINFRVIIISNYLADDQDSMLKYSELIHSSLTNKKVNVETIRPLERAGKLKFFFPYIEKWLFYIDKYLLFPIDLLVYFWSNRSEKHIVYHITDHSNAIYSYLFLKKALVVTCHDVLAIRSAIGEIPENPTGFTGKLLQKFILNGLRISRRIVCVSEKTEREYRRLIGAGSSKVSTILNPMNFNYCRVDRDNALEKTSRLRISIPIVFYDNFILHVGGNQWYKNRIGVTEIFSCMARERLDRGAPVPHLLLVGKKPSVELHRYVKKHSDLPICFVISPTTEELQALYSLAKVLLFPSLDEGFGWPILEAMACGCPVVTSNKAPLTEVGGEAAVYIDPMNISHAARILNNVLEWSESERALRVQKGLQNIHRFSNADFVKNYLSAYRDAFIYK